MTTIRTDILCIEILRSIRETEARLDELESCLNTCRIMVPHWENLKTRRSKLQKTLEMLHESLDRATQMDPQSIFNRQKEGDNDDIS